MFILRLASAGRPPPMAGLGRTDGIGPPDPRTIRGGSKNAENVRHAPRPDPRHPLVPLCEGVLGTEDPETLAARGDLATWTGQAGDPTAARDQFTDLLPVRERVLGPEHPDALTVRGNVARWTGEAGAPAAARNLFAKLLPVYERVMGAEQPDTLDIHTKLAHWTEQGKHAG